MHVCSMHMLLLSSQIVINSRPFHHYVCNLNPSRHRVDPRKTAPLSPFPTSNSMVAGAGTSNTGHWWGAQWRGAWKGIQSSAQMVRARRQIWLEAGGRLGDTLLWSHGEEKGQLGSSRSGQGSFPVTIGRAPPSCLRLGMKRER